MADDIVLGIDAGGSKTVALAADGQGTILGRARSGPANYHVVGSAAAVAEMNRAVGEALREAAVDARRVRAVCIGAAGVDRPEDWLMWDSWVRGSFPGVAQCISNDAFIVLAAGTPDGWGLAIIAGTGSIVYGRDRKGGLARAGGWGYLMGDEGSNYAIGQAALRAVTRAADGRGPQTALVDTVLAHWSLNEPDALVSKVYTDLPRKEIARLGRVVEETAAMGDAVANAILEEAARELSLAARCVAARLAINGAVPCALAGSVLTRGQRERELFLQDAAQNGLSLNPVTLVEEPAQGAVKLAIQELKKKR